MQNAGIQAAKIGTAEGRQVIYDAARLEDLLLPLWIEGVNPASRTAEGYLVESQGPGRWAVSTFAKSQDGFAPAARVFTLVRDNRGSIRVQPRPDLMDRAQAVREVAEVVLATLSVISAPMLTEIVDEKPPRRGMTRFKRIRMAEPWNDTDRHFIPRLGKATRPAYVADELLDEIYVLEGRIWGGVHQFETSAERDAALAQMRQNRSGITGAMRLVLSPLTAQAAAEVAEGERAGMDKARELVVLPDFLTWIEWRDAPCGVPGQRWGALIQACEDTPQTDAVGLLFALPADWTLNRYSFQRLPMLSFELRLKSVGQPLLEVSDISEAMAEAARLTPDGSAASCWRS